MMNPFTCFYVSGFPKSGNKWLQWQLMGFESIGGYHVDPRRGLPVLGSSILENQPLLDALAASAVDVEKLVRRMFCGHDGAPIACDAHALNRLDPLLAALAVEASRASHTSIDKSIFKHVFDESTTASIEPHGKRRAFGVPGMHTPLAVVRNHLPGFRIVNLVRDPRDVVVSYFYHYIATLTQPLAEKLVHWNPTTGAIEHNPKWKRPFARRVMRSMLDYHAQRLPEADEVHEGLLRVRYEDLLDDGVGQLQRLLRFLGCDEPDATVAAVVEANRFEHVTGTADEQRDSLVRKGRSGDWRNYFDRELLRALGDEFPVVVRELGYEVDDSWLAEVPRDAPRQFEFSRFRIQRSTTRQFAHLWSDSPELRARFPNPWDVDESESFFTWLCHCDHPQVQAWLRLARRLEELWAVDVVER